MIYPPEEEIFLIGEELKATILLFSWWMRKGEINLSFPQESASCRKVLPNSSSEVFFTALLLEGGEHQPVNLSVVKAPHTLNNSSD